VLVREAGRTFPASLAAVDAWVPPWSPQVHRPTVHRVESPNHHEVRALLAERPVAPEAVAALLTGGSAR
jgi:hypothetical protein